MQLLRDRNALAFDAILHLIAGAFIGNLYAEYDLNTMSAASYMYCLALGMIIGVSSLRVFGQERTVFWREAAPGSGMALSRLAYFIAKNIVEIPRIALLTFSMTITYYALSRPRAVFLNVFEQAFAASFAVTGYGYFFSILTNAKSAQMMMVSWVVVSVFSGRASWRSPVRAACG